MYNKVPFKILCDNLGSEFLWYTPVSPTVLGIQYITLQLIFHHCSQFNIQVTLPCHLILTTSQVCATLPIHQMVHPTACPLLFKPYV